MGTFLEICSNLSENFWKVKKFHTETLRHIVRYKCIKVGQSRVAIVVIVAVANG